LLFINLNLFDQIISVGLLQLQLLNRSMIELTWLHQSFNHLTYVVLSMFRPMRRVQQAAYPMVKLTQAEVAAMIGRREERRRLAEVAQL
jgi:hypothetical protein